MVLINQYVNSRTNFFRKFQIIVSLYIVLVIGSYLSFVNLLYIGNHFFTFFLFDFTLINNVFDRYDEEINIVFGKDHDWLQSLKWCSHIVKSIRTIWSNQLLGFNFFSFSTLNSQHRIGKGAKLERVSPHLLLPPLWHLNIFLPNSPHPPEQKVHFVPPLISLLVVCFLSRCL